MEKFDEQNNLNKMQNLRSKKFFLLTKKLNVKLRTLNATILEEFYLNPTNNKYKNNNLIEK